MKQILLIRFQKMRQSDQDHKRNGKFNDYYPLKNEKITAADKIPQYVKLSIDFSKLLEESKHLKNDCIAIDSSDENFAYYSTGIYTYREWFQTNTVYSSFTIKYYDQIGF